MAATAASSSPSASSEPMELLATIVNATAFALDGDTKSLLCSGALQVTRTPSPRAAAAPTPTDVEAAATPTTVDAGKLVLMIQDAAHPFTYCVDRLPVMRVAPRNYVLAAQPRFFGLVLAPTTDEATIQLFEALLTTHARFRVSAGATSVEQMREVAAPPSSAAVAVSSDSSVQERGAAVADVIGRGGKQLAKGIIQAAVAGGAGLKKGSDMLKTRITPAESDATVSDSTKRRVAQAKSLSGVAVSVSKALVTGAVAAADALGKQLTTAVESTERGQQFFDATSGPKSEAAKQVAKASLGAAVDVYDALQHAGLTLLSSAADATSDVVEHKYGAEAGTVARDAGAAVRNLGESAVHMNRVGVAAITKRAVINSSQELLASSDERARRDPAAASGPAIDPMVSLSGMMVVNSLSAQADAASAQRRAQLEEE